MTEEKKLEKCDRCHEKFPTKGAQKVIGFLWDYEAQPEHNFAICHKCLKEEALHANTVKIKNPK